METNIKFSHKDRNKNADSSRHFYFVLTQKIEFDEHRIYFYTYSDLSGFGMDRASFSNPYDFITLGIAIITEKEFIKNEVEKHLND